MPEPAWRTLLSYLDDESLVDADAESALTALRRSLLEALGEGSAAGERLLPLLSSLAGFCAASEYVLAAAPEELERLARLEPQRQASHALMLDCYRAAAPVDLPLADIRQLRAPADATSLAVQAMYEENPYPRWRKLPLGPVTDDAQRILVAGCGTGKHALMSAQVAPRAQVVGIDLSRASLAYALLKAREHGIGNAEFIQGDLLDAGLLERRFDVITCVGVLHHMDDPLAGLLALKGVMAEGARMKIALYSRAGRASILAAIALRERLGVAPSAEGIRQFRQVIHALPAGEPARGVTAFEDFYSISGCRDLMFHVKEHNYSVAEFAALIASSQMKLVGFPVAAEVASRFEQDGHRDPLDLRAWATFEDRNPTMAGAMYRAILAL